MIGGFFAILTFCVAWTATADEAIIDTRSGKLIAREAASAPRYPASTTKLMTIYVVLEAALKGEVSLDTPMPVSAEAAKSPPVKLGLTEGENLTLATAIHVALTRSSNDAARFIAVAVSGDEATFAARMTETARALGMRDTVFRNATGLPDRGHISTAANIARLVWRVDQRHGAYLRPLFRKAFVWRGVSYTPRNATVAGAAGAKLGKTGFTCAAGYTAAVLVENDTRSWAIATLANGGVDMRAVSLSRLGAGLPAAKTFVPPCLGERTAPPPPPLGDWSLTLGVFPDRRAAISALRDSRRIIARAERMIATLSNGRGFYAVMLADGRAEVEKLRKRLTRAGITANLIDGSGRRALGLKVHSRP